MSPEVIEKLNKLNLDFYNDIAADFSDSRNYSWSGWDNILPFIQEIEKLSVADLGAGNGRFLQFLREEVEREFNYTGFDFSGKLLTIARELESSTHKFKELDIFSSDNSLGLDEYNLIVAFGLMHHIPGYDNRKRVLEVIKDSLKPGGYLILSFWMFDESEKFRSRYLDPSRFGIDSKELEKNDFLLDWRRDSLSKSELGETEEGKLYPRYAHHYDESEISALVQDLKVEVVEDFRADGKSGMLNRYLVLKTLESAS